MDKELENYDSFRRIQIKEKLTKPVSTEISGLVTLSAFRKESSRKQAIKGMLLNFYEDTIKPRKRFEKTLDVLSDSLDPTHALKCFSDELRFLCYINMAETALERGQWTIFQLSIEELEFAIAQLISSMAHERRLREIRENVYYEAIGHYLHEPLEKNS